MINFVIIERGINIHRQLTISYEPAQVMTRGRSQTLSIKRNKLLLDRYFYYTYLQKMNLSAVYEEMELDFFITPRRVADLVQINIEYILQLRQSPPSVDTLRKKWPKMVWNALRTV